MTVYCSVSTGGESVHNAMPEGSMIRILILVAALVECIYFSVFQYTTFLKFLVWYHVVVVLASFALARSAFKNFLERKFMFHLLLQYAIVSVFFVIIVTDIGVFFMVEMFHAWQYMVIFIAGFDNCYVNDANDSIILKYSYIPHVVCAMAYVMHFFLVVTCMFKRVRSRSRRGK